MHMISLTVIVVACIAGSSHACNSKDEDRTTPRPLVINQEQRDPSNADEEDIEDEEDDAMEAFPDKEDEDVLCQGYEPKPAKQELPEAVVIGVRKGGTRALLEFINMHSLIRRAKSEVHFYDKHYHKGVDWYVKQMPNISDGQIGMEKTPGYFHVSDVPKRLFETKNDTKLILILRDPVKRLLSDYNQFYHNQMKDGNSYPPVESFVINADGEVNASYQPLQRSIYHKHMANWLKYFPLSQIYIVDGERFIKEPWLETRRVEDFLGLPNELTENNFYFNQTKGFYCGREEIRNLNSGWTCTRNKCLSKSKGRKPPAVREEVIRKLYDFMEPHNQIFFNLINRSDFTWNLE